MKILIFCTLYLQDAQNEELFTNHLPPDNSNEPKIQS